MAIANVTSTTTAQHYKQDAELLADAIWDALYDHDFWRNFVRFYSIQGAATTSKDFPKAPSLSAAAVAETNDIPYTQYTTTRVRATVSEIGIVLALSRMLRTSDIVDDGRYARDAGMAVADKTNTDVMSLSQGFSGSVGPTTGNALTEDHVEEGIATLEGRNMRGPFAAAATAAQKRDLVGSVGSTFTAAGTSGDSVRGTLNDLSAIRGDGRLGTLFGFPWFLTEACPTANSGADVTGMLVDRTRAIAFVEKWPVSVAFDEDPSARLREVIVTRAYATQEVDDLAGLGIQSDAGP